ncbi:cystatin-B-like [Pomacea canaliculata]|uniref:cystatin-B-like n=1 Tax=Pomacea canaliculata TaxID=400727 RepID=UPI000D73B066|nr:cystatin-B-like [Pomacea canaliculata]XP_025098370.1 cystatin-B-like [Pomacea canaliculata]
MEQENQMCGGLTKTRDAGEKEQALADKVRPSLEKEEGKTFPKYVATKYRSQVVNGINYFIKIDVNEPHNFIHAKIYESFDQEVSLQKYEKGHTDSDEIKP